MCLRACAGDIHITHGTRLAQVNVNAESSKNITLHDDLVLKVSSLLMEDVGSTRTVKVMITSMELDGTLMARNVTADIRLMRLNSGILATGSAEGVVEMECVRCLNLFEQPFTVRFTEQFRQTTDILSGRGATPADDDDGWDEGDDELAFEINDAHELDLTELLRQWIVLALPMTPICGPDCPGPQPIDNGTEEPVDDRFAALQQLLDDEDA